MKRGMITLAVFLTVATVALGLLCGKFTVFETLAITCGTFAYHLLMRLGVGYGVKQVEQHLDPSHGWFRTRAFETVLYDRLKVKRWKKHVPSWEPAQFSLQAYSMEAIVQHMCGAELVHELIVVLSFAPITVIPVFGAPMAFILTSLMAAAIDTIFVILQRYNRPRMMRLIEQKKKL